MKHSLYSQDQDMTVKWFDKFDKEEIKCAIIEHLQNNPTDTIEHCKEFNKSDVRKYYGNEILNFYRLNSKGLPCKLVTKGDKNYLKPLNLLA
jgi:hypothetical protein